MRRIPVIGGGLAGLTAAVSAAEAGAKVTVYEAHHRLGGRARTAEGAACAGVGSSFTRTAASQPRRYPALRAHAFQHGKAPDPATGRFLARAG
ncbi:FAD-dependent oxidoreductase [Streptomyces sp. MK7]|uniref:FAD-dependent oxidoreductase n=1 Tax=Streptomyces sp. MK7 TaxID=3067635 RepID=UPI00292F2E41|nr:FAD-dependent oxidoreductase [Streptomyces sp. MK7]